MRTRTTKRLIAGMLTIGMIALLRSQPLFALPVSQAHTKSAQASPLFGSSRRDVPAERLYKGVRFAQKRGYTTRIWYHTALVSGSATGIGLAIALP